MLHLYALNTYSRHGVVFGPNPDPPEPPDVGARGQAEKPQDYCKSISNRQSWKHNQRISARPIV